MNFSSMLRMISQKTMHECQQLSTFWWMERRYSDEYKFDIPLTIHDYQNLDDILAIEYYLQRETSDMQAVCSPLLSIKQEISDLKR